MDMNLFVDAKCGKLDYLCCLGSVENFRRARDVLSSMSDSDLETLYMLICSCPVTKDQGGKQPPVLQHSDCVATALNWLCGDNVQTVLKGAQGLLATVNILGASDPTVASIAAVANGAVTAAIDACIKKVDADIISAMNKICDLSSKLQDLQSKGAQVPEPAATLVKMLWTLFMGPTGQALETATKALAACCTPGTTVKQPNIPVGGPSTGIPVNPQQPGGSAAPYPVIMTAQPTVPSGSTIANLMPSIPTKPMAYVVQPQADITRPSARRESLPAAPALRSRARQATLATVSETAMPGMRVK